MAATGVGFIPACGLTLARADPLRQALGARPGVQHLHAARIASSRFQLRTTGTDMATRLAVAALSVSTLLGCASAKLGDKSTEAELKRFEVAPGRVSLYVCREDTMNGGGIGTEVFVNGKSAGALKPNTFAHALVEPGEVQIFLRRNGLNHNAGDSGTLTLKTASGQVLVVWAGPAGFMGPLTVDNFPSEADGRACVRKASYAVR